LIRAAADKFHQQRNQADRALGVFNLVPGGQIFQRAAGKDFNKNCLRADLRMKSGSRCLLATEYRCAAVWWHRQKTYCGFKRMSLIVPTLIPAIRTSEPTLIPSIARKLAVSG